MQYLIFLTIFAAIFLLTVQFFPVPAEKAIRARIASQRVVRKKEQAFSSKLLQILASLNRILTLRGLKEQIQQALTSAGSSLHVEEFLAVCEICALIFPAGYLLVVGLAQAELTWIMAMSGFGLLVPALWLRQKVRRRKQLILKSLPNVLALLNLAVGAGLDFMVAVKRMVERAQPSPLTKELYQVWQQTNMGKTRQNALRNMAHRINVPEVSSFVRTLIQADKMGTGIAEALQRQSEEVLTWRFQKGEAQAMKAPIKMLFPLLVFILPVVFIVVAGPIILQFVRGGIGL